MGPIKPRQAGWSMTDNMTSRHLGNVYCHRNRSGKEKKPSERNSTGWLEQTRECRPKPHAAHSLECSPHVKDEHMHSE
jgi:hypothetical protein